MEWSLLGISATTDALRRWRNQPSTDAGPDSVEPTLTLAKLWMEKATGGRCTKNFRLLRSEPLRGPVCHFLQRLSAPQTSVFFPPMSVPPVSSAASEQKFDKSLQKSLSRVSLRNPCAASREAASFRQTREVYLRQYLGTWPLSTGPPIAAAAAAVAASGRRKPVETLGRNSPE